MLKFWKKNKQQPEQTRDVGEDGSSDQEQPLNSLEEVLKPLFERINPTAPEEYAGMYNMTVIIIYNKQTAIADIVSLQPPRAPTSL